VDLPGLGVEVVMKTRSHDPILTESPPAFLGIVLSALLLCLSACSDDSGPGNPTHLVFSVSPGSTVSSMPLSPGIAVSVRDDQGETVEGWDHPVTLTLEGGTEGSELLGTVSENPFAGIALFEGLEISSPGAGFRLTASSGRLEEALSDPFDVHEAFTASSVFAGIRHACSLQTDGAAHCWGANADGMLGNGDVDDRPMPFQVNTEHRFTSLSAHQYHTCGLTGDGDVFCWGDNSYGQLGDGTTEDSYLPVRAQLPGPALTVSAGGYQTCALLEAGAGYCWGFNYEGFLGVESEEDFVTTPSPVKGGIDWASLDTGYRQVCGLDLQGTAYCWGPNFYGENGDGTRGGAGRTEPNAVSGGHQFTRLIAGGGHCHGQTCGFTDDGTILCWGRNYQQHLEPVTDRYVLTPQPIVGDPGFTDLFIGPVYICGVTDNGSLRCFGELTQNFYGLDPAFDPHGHPLRLAPALQVREVATGQSFICVTTTEDEVFCWGDNTYGQLGSPGSGLGTFVPTPVWKPFQN
jgi:alpha-tubulin suppressor-like RCC1 family protein